MDDRFPYKRILVIGCPGSGKSTFARKLRDATGLPLYYLDMLFHRPDRTTVSREEFDAALKAVMARSEWIIDGNYKRTLPLRLSMCDAVFFFDIPLEECLEGAASRIGQPREDMPWIEQEFDEDFRQYIIDFSKDQLPVIRELLMQAVSDNAVKLFTFSSRAQADDYIRKI